VPSSNHAPQSVKPAIDGIRAGSSLRTKEIDKDDENVSNHD
jgi:hypothetical protein